MFVNPACASFYIFVYLGVIVIEMKVIKDLLYVKSEAYKSDFWLDFINMQIGSFSL